MRLLFLALTLLQFFFFSTSLRAFGDCKTSDETLEFFCLTKAAEAQSISAIQILQLNLLMNKYGYHPEANFSKKVSTGIEPTFSYEYNVNGGNPKKDLVIGSLTLNTDPSLYRKEDFALGVLVFGNVFKPIRPGKFIEGAAAIRLARGIETGNELSQINTKLCYDNHLKSWTYLSTCLRTENSKKELDSSSERSAAIELKKYFNLKSGFAMASLTLAYPVFGSDYEKNLGIKVKHLINKSSEIELRASRNTNSKESFALSFINKISSSMNGRLEYNFEEQEPLLGAERTEGQITGQILFRTQNNSLVQLGIQKINNKINYFDGVYPFFKISLNF